MLEIWKGAWRGTECGGGATLALSVEARGEGGRAPAVLRLDVDGETQVFRGYDFGASCFLVPEAAPARCFVGVEVRKVFARFVRLGPGLVSQELILTPGTLVLRDLGLHLRQVENSTTKPCVPRERRFRLEAVAPRVTPPPQPREPSDGGRLLRFERPRPRR